MKVFIWGLRLYVLIFTFFVFTITIQSQEIFRFNDFKAGITDIDISPDGSKIIASSNDGTVKIIDAVSGTMRHLYRVQRGMFRDLDYSDDGTKYLIAGYSRLPEPSNNTRIENAFIRIFNASTNALIHDFEISAHQAQFSPDGSKILILQGSTFLSTTRQGFAMLELETGTIHKLPTENQSNTSPVSMAFSPDGTQFATHYGYPVYDKTKLSVQIWDTKTFQKIRDIDIRKYASPKQKEFDSINNIAFLPDGERMITRISGEGKMQMWNVKTGKELFTFYGLAQGNSNLILSQDQKFLITDHYQEAKIWNLKTGAQAMTLLGRLSEQQRSITNIMLSPDLTKVISSYNNELVVYDMTNVYIPGLNSMSFSGINPGAGIRTIYDNQLDGLNTSAQDHNLTVIPGGFANTDYGQLSFGTFNITTEDETILNNLKASNLEGMTVSVQPNQVMMIMTEVLQSKNPVVFQCDVLAKGSGTTVNIGLLDNAAQESNAISNWTFNDTSNESQLSGWKQIRVMFNSDSGSYLPLLQISGPQNGSGTVWIDNLRVYELPLDNSEVRAFMN